MADPDRARRLLDVSLAAGLVLCCLPLLAVAALAVALDSPGPIIFRQERLGHRGRRFQLLKFRTMVADAEERWAGLKAASDIDGPVFKLRTDPRITRVGRWLRRWSVDELPQLFNVLRGEMALVGPRPLPPAQVDWADERFRRRVEVMPGLTGQWQITGRLMHVDYDRWLGQDCWYVEHRCLGLDLAILARTPLAVWRGEGAW